MSQSIKQIAVIGDGGWGTTLSIYLAQKGFKVTLWGPFPEYIRQVKKTRRNVKFLPGITIPKKVHLTSNLIEALEPSDLIVLATPSQYLRNTLKKIHGLKLRLSKKIILSVIKGIEPSTLKRVSEIIHQELGNNILLAVLSGPTIASEMAQGIPTTAVVASTKIKITRKIQDVFNSKGFRIYTNPDVVGVELGGSIKNVIAIACGVCDGLKLGTNTKAAIVTRGLNEMSHLGHVMGAKIHTFFGLSGLGDLVTTCFSNNSRNRFVGEQLGKGRSIRQILSSMDMVAEGVESVKALYQLSRKLKVPMPISTEVYRIIYENKSSARALRDLMGREMRAE